MSSTLALTILVIYFLVLIAISIYTAKNIASHIFVGLKIVPWVVELPLFVVLPLIIFIVNGAFRKRTVKS